MKKIVLLIVGLLLPLSFFAINAEDLKGQELTASEYQSLIKEAMKKNPPKNGEKYVFGFANLQRDMAFGVKVEEGIAKNADKAGVDLYITDNRLDGPTALSNAKSFIQRRVDFVIEFQTDINFGPIIMKEFNKSKIKVIAIDIPMAGATFFGANNPRSGFMGGSYLAQQALKKWGNDMNKGFLVVGELPQSGAIPAMRTGGEIEGFFASSKNFPRKNLIKIDTKNTLQESYQQMSNVLSRIPKGVPIMGLAINDQSVIGMLRATQKVNREKNSMFVGMGADEVEALEKEEKLIASVGYFPENYGNYLIPMALMELANRKMPPAVLVNHVMVNKQNLCKYYPSAKCSNEAVPKYVFPQQEFNKHLKNLKTDPSLKGFEDLIPEK